MFRKVTKLLSYNFNTLIRFEFIYKILSIFICSPLLSLLFKITMKVTGYKYLTIENILDFVLKPFTISMIILLLILITLYTLFELSTVIIIFDASRQKKKISLREVTKISIHKTLRIFKKPSNILFIPLLLFIIPFLNIGVTTSYISSFDLPEYISDFIFANNLYFILYCVFLVFLFYLLIKWIYIIHYNILDNQSFRKGSRLSSKLGNKHHIKDFLKFLLAQGLIYLIYIVFVGIGIVGIILINKFLRSVIVVNSLLITIIWLYLAISFILINLISTPISFAAISYLFYKHKEDNGELINDVYIDEVEEESRKKRFSKSRFAIVILLLVSGTYFTYGLEKGRFTLNIEHIKNIEVTAHRGASKYYPENTMAAFKGAKKYGADWVELDVQETKDGEIIISHDSNLKRVTGLNKNIWEVTYNEVSKLDAGSHFDKKFKNERIPLLKDVVLWAKENNMKLNIELKPTGHESNLEQKVVDIIEEFNFSKDCVITSAKYDSLIKVKKINKKIKTVYVMSIAFGDVTKLSYADGFSIEATNITNNLVFKIHKEGKEIFAWTVNKNDNINKMIDLSVDNIVTDDITNAKELIESSKTSNFIFDYVKFVQELF